MGIIGGGVIGAGAMGRGAAACINSGDDARIPRGLRCIPPIVSSLSLALL